MDSSSPSLLDELEKYEYKKSAPNSNSPAFVESKMKALIGEVNVRWQKQQSEPKKAQIERAKNSDDDMFESKDDENGVENDANSSDEDSKTVTKSSKKDEPVRARSSSPEGKSDESDYEPSSANTSDSESKEWLNKDSLKNCRKRPTNESYWSDDQFNKRRRVERDSDDENSNENDRLCKCKNSFDMLKQLRKMKMQKMFSKINNRPESNGATTSTDSSAAQNTQRPPYMDENESSAEQSSDASISRLISASISDTIHEEEEKKQSSTNFTLNRKRLVLDSDSEDDNSKGGTDAKPKKTDIKDKHETPKAASSSKRIVLLSSDEEQNNDNDNEEEESSDDDDERPSSSKRSSYSKNRPADLNYEDCEEKALKFFEEASSEELATISRSSERIADAIITLRPFYTFKNLLESIRNAKVKGLTTNMIDSYVEMLVLQNDLNRLLYSCSCISNKLTTSVNKLLDGNEQAVGQPKLIEKSLELKPYQIIGLNWLVLMHKQELNCILADEMGLGKTIQVIAFLAYLKENNVDGPHLIVVPSSTLDNWLNELRRWCPELSTLTYYGSMDDRKFIRNEVAEGRQSDFDVILSTYRVVTSSSDDKAFFKRVKINYAVFDEAHMLKSCDTARYRSLMKVKVEHRLLLTGTPLQNNLVELISLMHFVMPNLFNDHTENLRDILNLFQFKSRSITTFEQEKIEQAKNIMRPFVLRRLKSEVGGGNVLDQLPKKHELIEFCELTGRQLEVYGGLVAECAEAVKRSENNDGSSFSNSDARSFLMQLRKAANHPLLLRRLYDESKLQKMAHALCKEKSHRDADPKFVFEDMSVMSDFELTKMCNNFRSLNKFKLALKTVNESAKFQVLDKLLPQAKSDNNKVLLFSQFTIVLNIMEDYLKQRKYKYLRLDGTTPVVERQILIDRFNSSPELFVFLLSTRAGGLGINLTSANVIILHDIDYNPYNDRQAEDRCHRVGQTKEVTVIRLIAKNTIDESMLACAQRKLLLEKQVTSADQGEDEEDPKDIESLLKQALNL